MMQSSLKATSKTHQSITSLVMIVGELLSDVCPTHEELNFSAGIVYSLTNYMGYSDEKICQINSGLVEEINIPPQQKTEMLKAFSENYSKLPSIIKTMTP